MSYSIVESDISLSTPTMKSAKTAIHENKKKHKKGILEKYDIKEMRK